MITVSLVADNKLFKSVKISVTMKMCDGMTQLSLYGDTKTEAHHSSISLCV